MKAMKAYERVRLARANGRPTGRDYISHLFSDFTELHGDRRYADDPAVIAGVGRLLGRPVTVIAIEKGYGAKERTQRNFGAPNPEGYRKALRLMKQSEKYIHPYATAMKWCKDNAIFDGKYKPDHRVTALPEGYFDKTDDLTRRGIYKAYKMQNAECRMQN